MSNRPRSRSITVEIEIDAPRDMVWRALTRPEEVARWFPPISGGSGDQVGGKLLISWGESLEWWTTVVAIEKEKHLRWVDDPAAYAAAEKGETDKPAMAIDWYLETRDGKTVVRLVNSGFDASSDWDEQFDATEAGWKYFLFNLRHYLQRHPGTPRESVWERRKSPVSRDDLWNRLVAGLSITPDTLALNGDTMPIVVEHQTRGRSLWIRIPALDDALLFVELESGRDDFHCGLWFSTYGVSSGKVAALRDGLRAAADRIFAPRSS